MKNRRGEGELLKVGRPRPRCHRCGRFVYHSDSIRRSECGLCTTAIRRVRGPRPEPGISAIAKEWMGGVSAGNGEEVRAKPELS